VCSCEKFLGCELVTCMLGFLFEEEKCCLVALFVRVPIIGRVCSSDPHILLPFIILFISFFFSKIKNILNYLLFISHHLLFK
jgi:hypothetical protein